MTKPFRFLRAVLAVATIVAAQSCTVKQQNESQDLVGPSGLQAPAGAASPTARFTFAPDKPTANVPVAFDGKTSCPEGGFTGGCIPTDRTIVGFSWDFGDGTTDSGQNVSHVFKASGPFSVRLSVTSNAGLADSTTKSVQIDAGTPPKADFVFSPAAPGVGQTVQFNGAQSTAAPGRTIASYDWDFGDGGKGSGSAATHGFGSAGAYNVVLTVTDDTGQKNATSKSVTVSATQGPGAPTADFVISPTDPSVGQSVLFNATQSKPAASHSITSYAWNFGDGGTGSGVTANHSFGTAGTYAIVLVVTDDLNQTATASKTITIKATSTSPPPTADFVFSPAAPQLNQPVLFNATASTVAQGHTLSYAWNFGDNGTDFGVTPSHPYTSTGTFSVVLKVTDTTTQQTATTAKAVTVTGTSTPPPNAAFVFSPTQPALGDTVSFDARASSAANGRAIVSYKWTFGDNTGTVTSATPTGTTHVYSAASGAGTYTITLVVTDDAVPAATGTVSQTITVGNPPAPTAGFEFSPSQPAPSQPVVFDASTSRAAQGQTIVDYAWVFGDATAIVHTSSKTTTHSYTASGTYTVTLTVTDSAGRVSSPAFARQVSVGGAIASFTFSPSPASAGSLTLFDGTGSLPSSGASNIVSWIWNFGDSTGVFTDFVGTRSHTFTAPGTYVVLLTVIDNLGRSGSVSKSVIVN